ncbi:carboxypeptidase regulatory-like domain-containing protein [bacterium]
MSTGTIRVNLNKQDDWVAWPNEVAVPVEVGVSTYSFEFTGIDEYTDYYIFVFKNIGQMINGVERIEQYKAYSSTPLYVSTGTYNIGTITLEDMEPIIFGEVKPSSVTNVGSGIHVELFGESTMLSNSLMASYSLSSEGVYKFETLISGTSYYLRAYVDTNSSFSFDPSEPYHVYDFNGDQTPDPLYFDDVSLSVALIPSAPTSGAGIISGQVSYAPGVSSGTVRLSYWKDKYMHEAPDQTIALGVTVSTGSLYQFTTNYELIDLVQGSYYVGAFIDVNDDGTFDQETEPFAPNDYSVWVYEGGYIGGVDINITAKENITLRGKIVFSSSTADAYDGIGLSLYDTRGTYWNDDDIEVSTTTSFSPFSVAGSTYNFEFADMPIIKGKQYRLKAYKSGTMIEPFDYWFEIDGTTTTFYVEQLLGNISNAFSVSEGLTYTVGELKVSNNVETSTNVTISPDYDNDRDYAEISFDISSQGTNYYGSNRIIYRLIVDTNQDNIFKTFNYSDLKYDSSGNPIYEGNSVTWQELNALIARNADWYTEGWIYPGTSTMTVTNRWEGRNPNWQIVPQATYGVNMIILDTEYWTDDYASNGHIVLNDSTTLSVDVEVTGISGKVVYWKIDGSTAAVSGARVHASGPNGWGEAFTNLSGEYTIAGIKAGTYWVGVEAKGFTSANNNSVVAPAEGVTDIDFVLSKGGVLKGTITLPETFEPYYDKWGGYISQLWGGVNAWSETSPQYGWTSFSINSGTDTTTYELNLAPGIYKVRVEAENYVSSATTVEITETGADLDFTLNKAGKITGIVEIPDPAPMWGAWIDAGARTSDNKQFAWGGGQIMQGQTTGQFELRNVLPATYELRFHVEGYADKIVENVTVVTSSNTGTVTLTKGSQISGTLTINGDTTNLQYQSIWVDAYSRSAGYGTGTNVMITTDAVKSTAAFTISGLSAGRYELHTWLDGFELVDMPIFVDVIQDQTTSKNLTLNQYSGGISGKVTGAYTDYTKVYVTVKLAWWGNYNQPIIKQISQDGTFSISNLGTGEYIISANEYVNPPNAWEPGTPAGTLGEVIERVNVANARTTGGIVLALGSGNTISGTITSDQDIVLRLSDGTTQAFDLSVSTINLSAIPLKMQWFGMSSDKAMKRANITNVWTTSATYEIKGLSDDTYIVMFMGDINNDNIDDVAGLKEQVYVSGGNTETLDIYLRKGYSIIGTISRLTVGIEEHFHVALYDTDKGDRDEIVSIGVSMTETQASSPFSIGPVKTGSYMMRIYSGRENYKVAFKAVEVSSKDVTGVSMSMEKGAVITGTLVDGLTGSPVSGDTVRVRCEARPWVEGGWKETRSDYEWNNEWGDNPLSISTTTGKFNLPNLPAGTYNLRVMSNGDGSSTKREKKYIGVLIAGIVVPDKVQDVDVGTIKLYEGVTISGRVGFDANSNGLMDDEEGLSNIRMTAEPSSSHGETIQSEAKSDGKGYYKLEGIDENIKYWEVIAAERPWWGEGIRAVYGEKSKDNIAPKTTNVDFLLEQATADLKGKIVAEDNETLINPFEDEIRGAMIILSEKGKIYDDPLGGIEAISAPNGDFHIQGLVPGNYTMKVIAQGLATLVTSVELKEGLNEMQSAVLLSKGGTVQGQILDEEEQKVTTSLVEQVVAVERDRFVITFGDIKSDPATTEILEYKIEGLKAGVSYFLAMVQDDGDNIIVSSFTVTLNDITDVLTRNLVYKDNPPSFIIQIARDAQNDKKFLISIFVTETLSETEGTDIIQTVAGKASGTLPSDEIVYSDSKDSLTAYYYLDNSAQDSGRGYFTLQISGHDLTGQETSIQIQVRVGMKAKNEEILNPLIGGQVKLGEGDITSIYVPGGAIDTDDPNSVKTIIVKIDSSEITGKKALKRPMRAYPFKIPKSLYSGDNLNNLHSGYYDIEIREYAQSVLGATLNLSEDKTAKISIQFDTTTVTGDLLGKLDAAYYDDTTGVWKKEKVSREINTTNGVISIDVNHLSKFAAFTDTTAPDVPAGLTTYAKGRDWIELSWDQVTTNDLDGYKVYRSTVSEDTYLVEVSTIPAGTVKFKDTSMDTKKTYYYKVSSFDDCTTANESTKSQVVSWTGVYSGPFITYVWPSPYIVSQGIAKFRYKIPGDGTNILKATLKIYNIAGELVRTLLDNTEIDDGILDLAEWDGTNDYSERVASGVYIYVFKAGEYKEIKKFAVVK